jgi:uncharacterized protein
MVFAIEEIGEEGLDFKLVLKKDQLFTGHKDLNLNDDITIKGTLTRIDDNVYLKGGVTTSVVTSCSRCLDALSYPIDSELKSHFLPMDDRLSPLNEVELHASDIDVEVYEKQQIDITQSIRDIILLTVPVIFLCDEGCKGLCSHCGKNLNHEFCQCSNESFVDPRLKILKILKDQFAKGG